MKTYIYVGLLLLTGTFVSAFGQIRSVTLGIQTHCPYGIKGCWAEIRDGLESPEEILAISKGPDTKTGTCEVIMHEKWLPDPDFFAHNFTNMHIGVDVRGVEAVVDGSLEKNGTNLVVRVAGKDILIQLVPLTRKVQWDSERKEPESISARERDAFAALSRKTMKRQTVRIRGPLRKSSGILEKQCELVLEVREFELLKSK
jgi:hypothetical protein